MGTIISVLNKSGAIFCQHGLTMLVQFGLLASLLFLVDIAMRRRVKASLRYCLWSLVLVKLVLPTTLSLPTGIGHLTGVNFSVQLTQGKLPEPQMQTVYAPPIAIPVQTGREFARPTNSPRDIVESRISGAAESPALIETTPLDWRGGIFIAWLFGVLVLLAGFIRRIVSIKKLITQSEPAPERLVDLVRSCQERIGVRGEVALRLSNNMVSPAVCGLFRHVIIVPTGLLEKMDRSKLAMVLMHELSHVKRADLWVNLFQTILQIIYFYNPFVWAANAYVRRVREQAVDEMVLTRLNGEAASYSNTLIDIAEKAFSQPRFSLATVSIIESKSKLKERIKIMLSKPIPKDTKIGFAGLALIIAVAAVMLPMAKGMARKPGPEFVIKGHVNDAATGKPIAGAKVTDSERYAGGKYGAITDSNGNYSYKTWYEEHDVKCEASGYETEAKVLLTKISGSEQEKILDFALSSKKKDVVMQPVDFEITTAKFNRGDSIEITNLSGTASDIRPGATYVVKGRYKLESRDNAMLHVYATNGETSSSQGPIIKRGEGQFTRTFTLLKEGDLHLSFYPADKGESFGGVYFAQRGADTGTEAVQKTGAEVVDLAVESFNILPYPEGGLYTMTASIRNKGESTSPKFRVCFYKNDPERKKPMNNSAGPIKPGDVWNEGSMPFALKEGTNEFVVVLDPDNTIREPNRTNNEASMKVIVKDGKIVEKKVSLSSAKGIGKETTGISGQVINAAEFGDTNGANAGKNNRMSKPEKTGPPVVVKTTPETFANDVSADLNQLTVTFSQQMKDKSWAWVQLDAPYPETTGKPYYDEEKKTCTLPVKLEPGKAYLVAFNVEPYIGFLNSEGKPAKPYVLVFATKDKDGKPTPIPEDLITKAKAINEQNKATPAKPEGGSNVAETPYMQAMYNDIGPDGTITFKNTIRETNKSGREITTQNFINSDFVEVTAMRGADGRDLKFTSVHDGDVYRYEVTFNEPIPPNVLIEYTSDGTMKGLIKPVAGSEKTFQYYMRHSPAAGEPTQRIETYLLPAGAELISTTPKDMERRTKDGRIELHVEKIIPPGGSITTSFQYRMP